MQVIIRENLAAFLRAKCDKAKKRIWISSPYIGGEKAIRSIIGINWKEFEKDKLRFITDASNSMNYDYASLTELYKYFTFKSLPNLHAKIYIIDNECLLTSANLTDSGFSVRYESAVYFDSNEAKPIINYFENQLWNNNFSSNLKKRDIKRRTISKGTKGDSGNKNLGDKIKLPEDPERTNHTGKEDYFAWLKIDGNSEISKRSKQEYKPYLDENIKNLGILAFHKRPAMKRNDIVFLSYLAILNGEPDTCVYGKAKIEAPSRKDIDKVTNYLKERDIYSIDWELINHFNIGIGIKDLKLIKTSLVNGVWLKRDIVPNIELNSTKQQGHIKIFKDQFEYINKRLENKFNKFGSVSRKNPQGSWWNLCIRNSSNKIILKDEFIKSK